MGDEKELLEQNNSLKSQLALAVHALERIYQNTPCLDMAHVKAIVEITKGALTKIKVKPQFVRDYKGVTMTEITNIKGTNGTKLLSPQDVTLIIWGN